MEEDPVESIIKECQITCSQEEKLRRCRFALEPEEEEPSPPPPCPVQVTGIVMVSPPESGAEFVEDEFHTPPEHQSMSGSEDQGPEIRPVQNQVIRDDDVGGCDEEVNVVGDGFTDAETTVDLGKDSDNVGFCEPNLEKEMDDDDKDVCNCDVSKIDTEMTTDLGNACEVSDLNLSKVELDLKINKVLESDCGHSVLDKGDVCTEKVQPTSPTVCLGDTEPILVETENFIIGETEVVDLAYEGSCKEMGGSVHEHTATVDERMEGEQPRGYSASKNIEDLDAYRYVSSGSVDNHGGKKGVTRKRELPNSFEEPEVNEGLWVPRQSENDEQTFNNLLDAAGIVLNDDITDSDYIKTAKEHGLIYYRPRWWPPEGFDDQVMK